MNKFEITPEAVNDLEKIWLYTFQNWSIELADRYYELIMDDISFLSENPFAGATADHIMQDYRVSRVKSHLIFYTYHTEEHITVVRILHTNMDVDAV